MSEARRGSKFMRLALGAGLLAVAAVSVAIFVPRRRLAAVTGPIRELANSSMAVATLAWLTGLWREATAPRAPVFDDLRPFDEF
jgi:hypothetical protein